MAMATQDPSPRRNWLVTGASSGVGRELALAALGRGERVAAAARNAGALEDLVNRFPAQVLALPLDVRDERAVQLAVTRAIEVFGRIDVVVNSAGYGLFGPIENITDKQARAIFDTNFFGVLNVLRAVLPLLRQQRAGHVVQLSAIFGHLSWPGTGLLAATKQAVSAVTEALAVELAPLGVTFTLIEPGAINTPFLSTAEIAETGPDYASTAGALLTQLSQTPREEFSDPGRIVAGIFSAVDATQPPLRLALGRAAEEEIRSALTARLRELDNWSATSRAADSPPG